MYVIYALVDPDEIWKICYIGLSSNLYDRFTQHLRDAEQDSLKAQWLKSIRERNRVPYCKVLEEVASLEEARNREAYWIHFYKRLNMPLTNSVIPQVPQDAHTDEQVREIAVEATRDRHNTTEIRETIKRLRDNGMPHREVSYAVGLSGRKYSVYQAICKEEGV